MQYKDLFPYLKAAELHTRMNTAQMIANKINHNPNIEPYLNDIALALDDENEHVRFNLTYSLVAAVEQGINIAPLAPQLVTLLDDSLVKTQKEALWALVCLAIFGKPIDVAVEKLESAMTQVNNLTGNGAIALTAHYLNNKKEDKALLLLDSNPHAGFGIAYAATMHCLKNKENAFFQQVLGSIKAGLPNRNLITGVAGALIWAEDTLKMDISFAVETINQAIKEAKGDLMREAALGGIFMNMSMQKRK